MIAALDRDHPTGPAAREVLDRAGTLVIPPVLPSELDRLARRVLGPAASMGAVDDVRRRVRSGRAVLPEITADTLDAARAVRARHRDLRLDLADAVDVAPAADLRTDLVLMLDQRGFRVVGPPTAHKAFRVLPFDL
ncbi:PIN domain-containing protein [Kitasatospora sp. NPDC056327]|uniref:PIN domain-containing protein n=1 Tax=Kitasatospora sp. NPDC056327 TaxID=3345785 RepID=UPI0035DB9CE7